MSGVVLTNSTIFPEGFSDGALQSPFIRLCLPTQLILQKANDSLIKTATVVDRTSGKLFEIEDPFPTQLPTPQPGLLKALLFLQSLSDVKLEEITENLQEEIERYHFSHFSGAAQSFSPKGLTGRTSARQARAAANLFLSDYLPDRFTSDQPHLLINEQAWEVPVILTYPHLGSLGQVGSILVSTHTVDILSHTQFAEMKQAAQEIYETHRDAIEAYFL